MEFEDVNERVEWEARRVAAAFGVKEWEEQRVGFGGPGTFFMEARKEGFYVSCLLNHHLQIVSLHIENAEDRLLSCDMLLNQSDGWYCSPCSDYPLYNELMARSAYCLGFEDEVMFTALNSPLTAHEKVELRPSMPREFWPKTWLDEEANPDKGTEWSST